MAKNPNSIENLLKNGSADWNKARKAGKVPQDHTGATLTNLFSANADLSGLGLVGSEWEGCDLSKMNFRETDLSNAYFHGGRLLECDFRGANLEGATFERMKLVRCDFTGAKGLEDLELDDVDLDRVNGIGGEEAPPPPPPPAYGLTSFTREQRQNAEQNAADARMAELPPFRPQDSASALFARAVETLGAPPAWVLDSPSLKPTLPARSTTQLGLESAYREAVRLRLDGKRATPDTELIRKAQSSLRLGSKDAHFAAMYLRELGVGPAFRFSAAPALKSMFRSEIEVDDLTAAIDPRITGALLELQLPFEVVEHVHEARRRLSATRLFTALIEAGFNPDNNWQEALESVEAGVELANQVGDDRTILEEAFRTFYALPEEARVRRLGYLAESTGNLEQLARLPDGVEPPWLQGPESRECHDREMRFVQSLSAEQIPQKVAALAAAELGVPEGTVPEDSEHDLFIHLRCSECGKEKLLLQSP